MILEFIKDQMDDLNVPYSFWEWHGDPPETYFVGEFSETSSLSEDGHLEGEFSLSGFTRGTYASLDAYRQLIYKRFRNGEKRCGAGGSCAVYYDHSMLVPTGVEGVKRMDIYLTTREWSE